MKRVRASGNWVKRNLVVVALTTCAGASADESLTMSRESEYPGLCTEDVSLQRLDLKLALRAGLCRSSAITKAAFIVDEQIAQLTNASAPFYPVLSSSSSQSRMRSTSKQKGQGEVSKGEENTSRFGVTLEWLLLDAGERSANWRNAVSLVSSARLQFQQNMREEAIRIVDAFFRARLAEAALETAQEVERLAQQSAQTAGALVTAGAGSVTDRLLASNYAGQMQLRRVQAESELRVALAGLSNMISTAPVASIGLIRRNGSEAALDSDATQRPVQDIVERTPAVVSQQMLLAAAAARLEAASSQGKPTLVLQASWSRNTTSQNLSQGRTDGRVATAGLLVNVPIFNGYINNAKMASANAQLMQAMADLDAARQSAGLNLWTLREELRLQRERLTTAVVLERNANAGFGLAQGRYRAGLASILELLRAQTDLSDARQQTLLAKTAAAAAAAKLAVSSGNLHELLGQGRQTTSEN